MMPSGDPWTDFFIFAFFPTLDGFQYTKGKGMPVTKADLKIYWRCENLTVNLRQDDTLLKITLCVKLNTTQIKDILYM